MLINNLARAFIIAVGRITTVNPECARLFAPGTPQFATVQQFALPIYHSLVESGRRHSDCWQPEWDRIEPYSMGEAEDFCDICGNTLVDGKCPVTFDPEYGHA